MHFNYNKQTRSLVGVRALVAVIYILGFAIVPFPKDTITVWVAFMFSLFSLAAGIYTSLEAFGKNGPLLSRIYGFPIYKLGTAYAAVQLFFSVVVYALSAFMALPYWIVLLLSAAFLVCAAIGFLAADNARDIVEQLDTEAASSTNTIELFQRSIADMVSSVEDGTLKTELEALAEELRYSDPVSSEATKELDARLADKITALRETLPIILAEKSSEQVAEIRKLLKERNRICKASK